jgi:hypothetical protein
MRNSRWRVVGVMLIACAALGLTASVASAKPTTKFSVTVTDDFAIPPIWFEVSDPPSDADSYKIQLINNSIGPHVWIAVGGLPEDLTVEEFIDLLDSGAPPPVGAFEAGAVFAPPGKKHQTKIDLTDPGRYGFFCPITTPPPASIPHYQLGFVGLFDVSAP